MKVTKRVVSVDGCMGLQECYVYTVPDTCKDLPTTVCLCGSTRFKDEFIQANKDETLKGHIVLSVGMFGHQEGIDMNGPVKKMLDQLHLRKIDLADEVFVINVIQRVCHECKTPWRHDHIRINKCSCGTVISDVAPRPYIGESTAREIAYAKKHNKVIRYLNPME